MDRGESEDLLAFVQPFVHVDQGERDGHVPLRPQQLGQLGDDLLVRFLHKDLEDGAQQAVTQHRAGGQGVQQGQPDIAVVLVQEVDEHGFHPLPLVVLHQLDRGNRQDPV